VKRRTKWIAGGAVALAIVGTGTGVAVATGAGDESPLTGVTLEKASKAALESTGGGTVIETEVGDGGSAYEVEVRTDDGTEVEVNLDGDFNVIGSNSDDDGAGDEADESGDS
jgi:Peptidase propeptide and YPEB domain